MPESPLLEVADLACGYERGRPVLAGVSLAVPRGETVVLVGPSGCGKTTLLKTLLGLLPPLGGHARVLGRPLASRPPRGTVGYVPQGLGLVRHASALRNVLAGTLPETGRLRSLLGAFPRSHVQRAREALERVGLDHKAEQRPVHLSGGERRRVAIARALAQRPTLLLADEILSELDERTAAAVLDAVRGLQQDQGTGVLMVEHDVDRSCAVAQVVCCLGAGSLLATLPSGPGRADLAREVLGRGAATPAP